jgi:putative addiction module component (TIGR02574 family)
MMTKQQLLESAKALPKADRLELAMELWETIDIDDVPLTQWQRDDLTRRVAEDDASTEPARPWAEVREELRRGSF